MPDTEEKWRKIAKDFEERWQFPNCLGAIDGKHVRIIPPPGSGSYFWNYKNFNSIVLMACANANYEFIWCEVGTNGRVSDGGTIQNTLFYKKLQTKELNIPNDDSCQNSNTKLPFVFVGDEAFALRTDFMKPFSRAALTTERKIFNYRLSRARRIIENVFGIMSNRFRIFHSAINLSLDRIDLVVLTCCLLHNFLRKSNCPYATDNAFDIDSDETTATIGLTPLNVTNRNASTNAKNVREAFVQYFNGEGSVTWQYDKIA